MIHPNPIKPNAIPVTEELVIRLSALGCHCAPQSWCKRKEKKV